MHPNSLPLSGYIPKFSTFIQLSPIHIDLGVLIHTGATGQPTKLWLRGYAPLSLESFLMINF